MVNVPSSDKDHVISAWIVPTENTQRIISVKNFFMFRQNKKGADLPIVSSLSLVSPNTINADKLYG